MLSRYLIGLAVCLTLGLAPFVPEPHLVEKIRWLAQGTPVLRPLDWFDLVLHGAPWLALWAMVGYDLSRLVRGRKKN